MITYEINKLFQKEIEKFRGVSSQFNGMLKRKNILEAKLFKKRYEKVEKHLNRIPNLDASFNPFKKSIQSVFIDEQKDPMMDIPMNKELFNNVIKETLDKEALGDANPEDIEYMTDE